MNLLHCGLSTEQQIAEEEDVIWDWTNLFTEVVSILTASDQAAQQQQDPFGGGMSTLQNGTSSSVNGQPAVTASSAFGDNREDIFDALRGNKSDRKSQNRREIEL